MKKMQILIFVLALSVICAKACAQPDDPSGAWNAEGLYLPHTIPYNKKIEQAANVYMFSLASAEGTASNEGQYLPGVTKNWYRIQ